MLITTVKANDLAAGLQRVVKVRNTNAILPIMECVHCKTVKSALVLTCSNLNDVIQTGIKADNALTDKEFMIPISAQNILMGLKDVDVEIHNGDALSFKVDGNVFKVTPEDPDKFPLLPTVDETLTFELEDPSELNTLLQMHKNFTSKDDLRPAMTGIMMSNKVIVSTNAHQLCASSAKTLPYQVEDKFERIVSKTFINAFGVVKGKAKVKIGPSNISVNDKETKVIARMIDANFPDYKVVIPKDNVLHIKMDKTKLLKNVKMAKQMSNSSTNQVVFHFDAIKKTYAITAQDIDFGEEIKVTGDCEWVKDERPDATTEFDIAYNAIFLAAILDQITTEFVTFQMLTPTRATIMQSAGHLFLIMPLMLNL